jgi:aryl-alcohol dehydrogenase-like predicted oxidoreductase
MTWGHDTDADEAATQLMAFADAGGTLIDTADVYTDGEAERILGGLLGEIVPRDELVLATKAVARRTGGPFGGGASRGALLSALDGSLRRIGVDHIDLWQLHAWDANVPIEETLSAVDHAISAGKVRYAGISNYSGWQLATAVLTPSTHPLISTQVEYSLLERGIEREVAPAALHHGLGLLPWAPLGRGVLTGKYRTGTPADSRAASPHFSSFVGGYLDDRSSRIVEAVARAADGLEWTPVEVALAWVRDRPGVTAPIVGARTAAQLKGSLSVEECTLPPEIVSAAS